MKKKSLLLTALATLGLTAATMAQNVPSYVPTNGLVGWWPFDGNANDESGNGNNGNVNGATLSNDRFMINNKCYSFQNNSIEVPNNALLGFNPNNSFTAGLWVYKDGNQSVMHLLGKRGAGSPYFNWQFAYNTNIYFETGTGPGSTLGVNSLANLSSQNWTYIVGVYNNSTWNIYIDGVLSNTSMGIAYIDDLSNLTIGNSGGFEPFYGKIDDLGIWNRALTQQEITALYNGCQLAVNTQPINQTVNSNNNAQFIVGSSDPSATYQWQTDLGVGFQNLNSVGQYISTTTNTLTVSNVTTSNNNQSFRCIVSSGSCSDTSNIAVLTVNNNVGINENSHDHLFSMFPNPALSIINLKTDAKLIGSVYSIFDNKGQVVQTGKINSENITIELGILSSGIYMFSVGENMKQNFRVIKE
jgi:hypothetical protein